MDRADIIRKLKALRARFEHSATNEQEAFVAIETYNALMEKYGITEADLSGDNSTSKVEFAQFRSDFPDTAYFLYPISKVTGTTHVWDYGQSTGFFFGLRVDIEYADWLFRLLSNTLNTSSAAFIRSYDFNEAIRCGKDQNEVLKDFREAFITRVTERLMAMVPPEPKGDGKSLVVLKNALVVQAMEEAGINTEGSKEVSFPLFTQGVAFGLAEGDKVALRQEMGGHKPLLEKKGD